METKMIDRRIGASELWLATQRGKAWWGLDPATGSEKLGRSSIDLARWFQDVVGVRDVHAALMSGRLRALWLLDVEDLL